jgi:prevent-host-death family protein
MRAVTVTEVGGRIDALLDEVAAGGEVLITRDGQAVARLAPIALAFDKETAARAAAGLRELGSRLRLDGLNLKTLIAEGRD